MIDIEKLICSLLADHPVGITVREDIHKALKEQGLEYKDGKIVPIEDKTALQESDDKRIRNKLIKLIKISNEVGGFALQKWEADEMLSYLEKQSNLIKYYEDRLDKCAYANFYKGFTKGYKRAFEKQFTTEQASLLDKHIDKLIEQSSTDKYKYEWSGKIKSRKAKGVLKEMLDKKIKSADKVEPKFKVGDWTVCCDYEPEQIIGIRADTYYVMSNGDSRPFYMIDNNHNIRLWNLADAKEGDVLVDVYGNIGIFEKRYGINWHTYCYLGCEGRFISEGGSHSSICYPATKEQRDTLFAKMKEAGCEWNAEKKELTEIEQISTDLPNGEDYGIDGLYAAVDILQKTLGNVNGYQTDDGILEHECAISAVKKLYEQKSAWSEKDEYQFNTILHKLDLRMRVHEKEGNKEAKYYKEHYNWLKSLKDRVLSQSKQEWGEDDEEIVEALNYYVKDLDLFFSEIKIGDKNIQSKEFREKVQHWLKSLKEKYIWKPSDEQLKALEHSLGDYNIKVFEDRYEILKSLYNDLKKLK